MASFDKADIEKLIDGVLPWPATQDMLKSSKDEDRFDKYVEEKAKFPGSLDKKRKAPEDNALTEARTTIV